MALKSTNVGRNDIVRASPSLKSLLRHVDGQTVGELVSTSEDKRAMLVDLKDMHKNGWITFEGPG